MSSSPRGSASRQRLVDGFPDLRVLLIGDTIVDVYTYGEAIGKSAETPTIVAREGETKRSLGGAFLVARNVLELGAQVDFVTLVGDDEASQFVRAFRHPQYTAHLIDDADRRTTTKKRFWVDGYKLLQFDTLDNRDLSDALTMRVLDVLADCIERSDVVVVSDYRHGFLTPALARGIVGLCAEKAKMLYVDSQLSQSDANHLEYSGADIFVMNEKEARSVRPDAMDDGGNSKNLQAITATLGARGVVIKRGADGAVGFLGGRRWPSEAAGVNAVDTCGAGDAFLAALCLSNIAEPEVALAVANQWAGLSTLIHGTEPPQRSHLIAAVGG